MKLSRMRKDHLYYLHFNVWLRSTVHFLLVFHLRGTIMMEDSLALGGDEVEEVDKGEVCLKHHDCKLSTKICYDT